MKVQRLPIKERRQFGRTNIIQPTICQMYIPKSGKLREYRCTIKNICLGGMYFICDEKPPLEEDEIRHLIIDTIFNYQKIYRLKIYGIVARTKNEECQFAVAIKFLSDPIYYPIKNIKDGDFPFLDKIRIMYGNYELNKIVSDIIKNTPDIRIEKINAIKESIDQGSYILEPIKLARCITVNLTDTFEKIAENFYRRILK
jgi:Anti-sigma-28 factor, FlgM